MGSLAQCQYSQNHQKIDADMSFDLMHPIVYAKKAPFYMNGA